MSERWVLVPVEGGGWASVSIVDVKNMRALISAVPPIPEPVWAEMVERGARAICGYNHRNGDYGMTPSDVWKREARARRFYTAEAEACLRAALGMNGAS